MGVMISIHVPAWGTTCLFNLSLGDCNISIHVPAWGTTRGVSQLECRDVFQSTCPRGARRRCELCLILRLYFNPRARVGHDINNDDFSSLKLRFQSTCPRGARHVMGVFVLFTWIFQSTCPRGARPPRASAPRSASNFNPRARVGHDVKTWFIPCSKSAFQSTCPRGARLYTIYQRTNILLAPTPQYCHHIRQ